MKKFILSLFLVGFFYSLKAQVPNPLYFNTASNSTATGTLAVGANDLNWSACSSGSVGPYVPAVSCGNAAPCCWMSSPVVNSNWISYPHSCVPSSPADHSCLGTNQDEFYKLSFNLQAQTPCGTPITDSNAYCLAMDLYADNCVWEVFVNGVSNYLSTSSNPYYASGYSAAGKISLNLCNNWQAGTNDVIIQVKSGAAVSSFTSWIGLLAIVNGTLSSGPSSYTLPAININPVSTMCIGSSANLTANGATSYTWNPGGYIGNTYSVSPTSSTTYTVFGTGSNGCVGTETLHLSVADCTGISKTAAAKPEVTIYPNPTTGYLNINGINETVSIEVINSLGSLVYYDKTISANTKIDLSGQAKGIYFVRITGAKFNSTKKIIKE